jgi:hypothetical protein
MFLVLSFENQEKAGRADVNKRNQLKALLGTLSLLLIVVVVSCTRNLSVPITATVANATATMTNTITNTPPVITFTFTSTATATDTNTPTNTPTSTPTLTATNTLCAGCNTSTSTYTPTVTDTNTPTSTATNTDTSTITNTPTNTLTNTITPTPTNTTSLPSPTPNPSTDFDDFWCTNAWGPGATYGLASSGTGGGAGTLTTGVDTANSWPWMPLPEGNGAATYTPESASVTISTFGTNSPGLGYADFYFKSVWPNGNSSISGSPCPITGTTNKFDMQCYCPVGGPVTIEFIQLFSNAGDEVQTPNNNYQVLNNGQWTDIDIPLSGFSVVDGGSLANIEANGVFQIQMQVTGVASTLTVLDIGSLVFY